MQSMRKKLLSLLLALVMMFQLFPVTALAEDGEDAGEMPQLEETILDPSDWEEPVPVGEDESKREENIKQFRMTDGSWLAATYPLAVHYEENGEWVEIDNRLEEKELEYAVPFPEEGLKEAEELLPEEVFPGEGVGNKEPSTAEEVAPEETAVEEAPEEEGTAEEDPPAEEPTEDGEAADAEEPAEEPVEEPKEEPADEEPSEEPAEDPPAEANQDGEVAVDVIPPEGEEKSSRDDSKPVFENMYVNMQNRFGVSLPVVLNENSWFGVSDNGYRLFFRMVGVQESESVLEKEAPLPEDPVERAALVHYNSTVNYPNALPGAELKYDVRGQSLKETIIFPDLGIVPEQVSYQIWAEGMTAEVVEDSEIRFFADGELVFVFPTPFFMDSEGNSDGALAVELEDLGDGCFILRYTPEREWLESEERCWPVMLDPVITNVVNTNYIRDAYIRKGYPTYGGGLFYYFYAGFYSNATKAVRGLVKHTQIPSLESGDVIVGAYLTAHGLVYQSNGTQIQVDAHAITEDWDSQSVKWNNQPAYEEDVLDFQIVNSTADKLYTWDVTSAVQRWYGGVASEKGALENQGFMLISPTENDWNVLMAQFKSSDSSPSSYWPMLYISYRNTTGLESYWDYTSAGAGRAGTVYANNYTGNLVVNRSDMSYSGNRMPANIAFTYNQNDCTTDIGYGKGWRSAYSQQLEQVSISGVTYYKWTDGDGTRIYFHNKEDEWVDENGLSYKLSVGANGYTITDRDENSLGFDVNGRLISVTDKLNNSLSIAYTESGTTNLRISQVTDGAGRVYSFSYSNNLLSSVVYMGAGNTSIETASYTYDGSSLSTVTYADGKAVSYSYTGNTLTEARDIQRSSGNCNKLVISYGGTPSKVMGISYYDGATMVNSVSLRYGDHNTIVTDNVERWCSYEFNNLGNTVSVYNQAGQALYGSFATDENPTGRANQLIHSSRLQDTVLNLLDNRSEAGNWSETFTVQSGVPYSLSGVTAVGSTLSMTAGSETLTATSVSSTERTELTIMIPSGVTSLTISGSGIAWDLQLEQTEAASRYNLLSNSDMSSSSGWTGTNLGASDGIATASGSRARLNSSALVLEGSGTVAKSYTQTISVSGSMGDDYSFGGWVKSGSVPLSNKNDPDSTLERRCGIRIRLLNGSTEVDSKILDANTDCPEWQFLSGSIRATGTYDAVEFSFIYDYNANSSSFDGAQLFREKFSYVYHYDDDGRIDKITDLEGRETIYTYRGTTSDITSITLPGGAQYSYSYTSSGLLQSAVSDTGVSSSYSYDAYGNPTGTSITGGNEKSLTSGTTYTSDGNMTASVTGNDAETVTYTNDTDRSLVLSVTDPAGTVTTNSYDSMRRPVSSQTGSSSITNTYSDDLLTGLSHSNTANSSTQYTLGYTTADLLYSVQVGSIYTLVQNSYNAGTWTLARQDYGNGAGWAYSYNEFDQVTARWTTNGTTGVEFRYFYNSEGALARVEQHETTLSSGSITDRTLVNTERYYYDTGDRLIRVWETDANGNQHEFRWTYDSNDQITELVETVNGQSFTYANSYNGDKQPTQSSYGNVLEGFTYDGLGRMSQTAVSNSGSNVLTTDYTFRDLDSNRTTTQVEEIRNRYGLTDEAISYTYDSRGNIASVSFPWTVTVPDPEPTPTPTPDPTPTPTPTPDPTPTPTPGGNGNHGDWEIDPEATFLPILPTPTPDAEFNSGTQGNGSSGGVATTITVTIYYEYDALNELTWEKSELEEKAWHYSYDLGGNILSKTEYSYQNGTVGSTALSTVTYTYGDANWPDLLTTYNGSPITYDGMGNPLSYRGWTFTWQGGRQLASASNATTSLSFVYNESGLRTEKTVGNDVHRYVYRGSTLVAEITDDYALYFHHDARGEIVGFTYASGSTQTEYFYRKNLQGDVIGIVDSTGVSVAEYRYDAWGQILDASGTMASINPIRYRGYYYDAEPEMYYLHSRYYDPAVGRFVNTDVFASTGQGIFGTNMFSYCKNEPVGHVDIDGKRVVGIGFTVDVTSDRGTYGVEVVIYIDEEVIKNSYDGGSCDDIPPFVVVAYSFSGVSISSDDLGNISNTAVAVAAMFCNDIDLSYLDQTNCDEFLVTLNAFISGQCDFSGGAFLLFGNDQFVMPSSYSGPFDCYSVTARKIGSKVGITGYVSTSETCTAVGIKASLTSGFPLLPVSISYSKTYYSKPVMLIQ